MGEVEVAVAGVGKPVLFQQPVESDRVGRFLPRHARDTGAEEIFPGESQAALLPEDFRRFRGEKRGEMGAVDLVAAEALRKAPPFRLRREHPRNIPDSRAREDLWMAYEKGESAPAALAEAEKLDLGYGKARAQEGQDVVEEVALVAAVRIARVVGVPGRVVEVRNGEARLQKVRQFGRTGRPRRDAEGLVPLLADRQEEDQRARMRRVVARGHEHIERGGSPETGTVQPVAALNAGHGRRGRT